MSYVSIEHLKYLMTEKPREMIITLHSFSNRASSLSNTEKLKILVHFKVTQDSAHSANCHLKIRVGKVIGLGCVGFHISLNYSHHG